MNGGSRSFNVVVNLPKTLIFIIVTMVLLYYLNVIIKLNENMDKFKKTEPLAVEIRIKSKMYYRYSLKN